MKIHVVQKGDTLWELSKKYGVDFEELKQANSQLSSPDMIMPGMKIKIPGTAKTVKKEVQTPLKKEQVHPYKEMSPQPKPVIKEDDHKKKMQVQPQMPQMPPTMPMPQMPLMPQIQMPNMEQEMTNYTTINVPAPPPQPKEKEKKAKPPKHEHKHEFKPMPQPHMPMCCYVMYPCCPPHMQWHPPIHQPMPFPQPVMPYHFQGYGHEPMMEMPVKPAHHMNMADDCGCGPVSGHMQAFRQGSPEQENGSFYPPANMQIGEGNYPGTPSYQPFSEEKTESND